MEQTVDQVLSEAKLYTDHRDYIFVRLPTKAIMAAAGVVAETGEPFCALIVDKNEVSLVLPSEVWADFAGRLPGNHTAKSVYRLITLDVVLDMSLVGLIARVSQVLADANIPILPFAAYSRDHIFVPAEQFDIAMAALQKLQSGA